MPDATGLVIITCVGMACVAYILRGPSFTIRVEHVTENKDECQKS